MEMAYLERNGQEQDWGDNRLDRLAERIAELEAAEQTNG